MGFSLWQFHIANWNITIFCWGQVTISTGPFSGPYVELPEGNDLDVYECVPDVVNGNTWKINGLIFVISA